MNKISVRRLTGVIMALLTLAMSVTAMAESHTFEPALLTAMDSSASEWYKDEESQALFAAVAMLDIMMYDNEEMNAILTDSVSDGAVYVAKGGLKLFLCCFGSEDMVLAIYTPTTDTMEAAVAEGVSSLLARVSMEKLKDDDAITTYCKIAASDIATMLDLIGEAIEE